MVRIRNTARPEIVRGSTPSFAARPGVQVQIDSTPIDVMVLLDNGVPVRADLTIAVDIATGVKTPADYPPESFTRAVGIGCENVNEYYDPNSVF